MNRFHSDGSRDEESEGKLSANEHELISRMIVRCNDTQNGHLDFVHLIECLADDAMTIAKHRFDLDAAMADGWIPKS